MRQLATIQKITNIQPIPERDRVDVGTVLGWTVIVGKDQYRDDELVVFAEIDSLFPKTDDWIDLEKFKYRIKTFKVNSPDGPIYGQGYCFPISKLDEIYFKNNPDKNVALWQEGEEVTELLGITKYEAPDPSNNSMLIGNAEGVFPTQYLSKTDEIRLEAVPNIINEIEGKEVAIRMKIDGTSVSMLKIDGEYKVCSRNNMLKNPENSGIKSDYWTMFYKYPGIAKLLDLGYALQGEMAGAGIQKNHLKLPDKQLFVFNIIDLKTRTYVDNVIFENLCREFELQTCPIVYQGIFIFSQTDLQKMADTLFYSSGKPAEGIVIRPVKEQYSRVLRGRMSFKQISRVFLSKDGD